MTHQDLPVAICMVIGVVFCFLAALGLVRMPDFYSRVQGITKATTLGTGFVMLAVALFFTEQAADTRAVAIVLFQFITAPVSGQMLSRAAYLLGTPLDPNTKHDALKGVYPPPNAEE